MNMIECDLCGEKHEVEIRKEIVKTIIKGTRVAYEEICYYCSVDDEEFFTEDIMNENLLRAMNNYKNIKKLQSSEKTYSSKNLVSAWSFFDKDYINSTDHDEVRLRMKIAGALVRYRNFMGYDSSELADKLEVNVGIIDKLECGEY